MAVTRINNDTYVLRLRNLFMQKHDQDLEYALTAEGAAVINDHFFARTLNYHFSMVPWIETVFPLEGRSVLEIGCGSGAATFAVAQRCGHVDAFDIDAAPLSEAIEHKEFFGISNIDFHHLATDWAYPEQIEEASGRMRPRYDAILFPAVLEHMEIKERLAVLEMTWRLLRVGGVVIVYDTPNRLHPFDMHSFRLPFFDWLPNDLALLYASRSPRTNLTDELAKAAIPMHTLYRLGRGLSYHEFDLAIGLNEMEVLQDGYSNLLTHRAVNGGFEGMIAEALRQHAPHVPPSFSKEYLEFVARKKWDKLFLVERHGAKDELLDQRRPALVISGDDAGLEYDLGDRGCTQLLVEVLRHPWSSELVFSDSDGEIFHRETLTATYSIIDLLRVTVPALVRRVRLQSAALTDALDNQVWILGVGCVRDY